jgi:hypothetical protein
MAELAFSEGYTPLKPTLKPCEGYCYSETLLSPAVRFLSTEMRLARCAGRISDGARSGYAGGAVRCGLECGLRLLGQQPVTYWVIVGLDGLEPPTSPLSVWRSLVPRLGIQVP